MVEEVAQSEKIAGEYDVIIIGAGGSGLAAGMYSGRLGMRTLVLGATSGSELPIGGVITTTHIVDNYPGFISLRGEELAKKIEEHAREYGIDIIEDRAVKIERNGKGFVVNCVKNQYKGSAIIYAAGTVWKKLGVPGEEKFTNRGVSYCALCDGPLFRDKVVAVIGGSDSAAKEALLLGEYARKVYIIARRDRLRAEPINLEKVARNKKIEIILNTNIKEIAGEQFVSSVVLDNAFGGKNELALDGVFIAIGHIPLSDLAREIGVALNDKGEILVDRESRTNILGFFACGDVVDSEFKQLITGVAEGVRAAYHAYNYVSGKEFMI